MWDEERLVREEAHAERRVALFATGTLDVAAHDPRAGDDPMKLPRETGRRRQHDGAEGTEASHNQTDGT